jgi:hypothetical protein
MNAGQLPASDGDREMESTESDLRHDHPDIADELIHTLVRQAYSDLTPAKVHSFLPILVARDVQARLRARAVA